MLLGNLLCYPTVSENFSDVIPVEIKNEKRKNSENFQKTVNNSYEPSKLMLTLISSTQTFQNS